MTDKPIYDITPHTLIDYEGKIGGIVWSAGFEDETAGISECQKLTGWMFWEKRKELSGAEMAKAERATAMLSGAPYTLDGIDYQISFTSEDGNGVMQVRTAFDLGVEATTIYFSNGTKMPITSVEFGAFAAWFVQKRNEFFV